ncbi:MAG: DUF3482 domain-containing protein [Epsilonproteobacteria bacterium]|nr:DUF3482 domain-containing protein [Campylobacterota bacterium]
MRDSSLAPTFTFIGKPNNGKSSIISVLTMDDRIEVSPTVGTTTTANRYSYIYKERPVAHFYDTPGFERAREIYRFIKRVQQEENFFGNRVFYEFIKKYENDESFTKDIEILKAILDSDFVVFVVNISQRFNLHVTGSELEILKKIDKPVLILFNQIEESSFQQEWEQNLIENGFEEFYMFNPLQSGYKEIEQLFEKLYTLKNNDIDKRYLEFILQTHKTHFQENINQSISIIADTILEILQYEYIYNFKERTLTSQQKGKVLEDFRKKIFSIEQIGRKKINEIWGYHQVQIKDIQTTIDAKENLHLGLTKEKLIALGMLGGATLTSPLALFDFGLSMLGGAVVGGVGAYFVSDKLFLGVLQNKRLIYSIEKKNVNVSLILIKRSLEHLYRVIQHGHANRETIVIPEDISQWKFGKAFDFSKEQTKKISKIHRAFIEDKETLEAKKELEALLQTLIQKELVI